MSRSDFLISPITRSPKASDLIAAQLRSKILSGDLSDGDLLPPETQLSTDFGVARPTLREAFRILETEGLIEVARGSRSGAKVRSPKITTAARYAGYSLRNIGATLIETYKAQLAIEPYAVRLLAENPNSQIHQKLELGLQSLTEMQSGTDIVERRNSMTQFHKMLVSLTGNRALLVMAEILYEVLASHQAHFRIDEDTQAQSSVEELRTMGIKSIRKLIALIKAGDPEVAEAHWRKHLQNAMQFWLHGLDAEAIIETYQ